MVKWLTARMPAPLAPSLIHNDYKLDNIMLAAGSPDRVEAVLDWEMATLGDPLSDLGLTLCYWIWATEPEVRVAGIPALTSGAGWFTRDELVEQYAEAHRSRHDPHRLSRSARSLQTGGDHSTDLLPVSSRPDTR